MIFFSFFLFENILESLFCFSSPPCKFRFLIMWPIVLHYSAHHLHYKATFAQKYGQRNHTRPFPGGRLRLTDKPDSFSPAKWDEGTGFCRGEKRGGGNAAATTIKDGAAASVLPACRQDPNWRRQMTVAVPAVTLSRSLQENAANTCERGVRTRPIVYGPQICSRASDWDYKSGGFFPAGRSSKSWNRPAKERTAAWI